MTVDQVKYLFKIYGKNTIIAVSLNNGKRVSIGPDNRDKMIFDDEHELLRFPERVHGMDLFQAIPYEFIECLTFKDGMDQPDFANSTTGPGIVYDKYGNPAPGKW